MIKTGMFTEKLFEDIKHIGEFGNAYWFARELLIINEEVPKMLLIKQN